MLTIQHERMAIEYYIRTNTTIVRYSHFRMQRTTARIQENITQARFSKHLQNKNGFTYFEALPRNREYNNLIAKDQYSMTKQART